jgi:DNA-binding MarR family transcriptional regulator
MLKKTTTALRAAMDSALRPLDLTVSQFACLEVLGQQPGLSGSDLARALFVSRQSMNLLVKGLERRGLLARSTTGHGKTLPTALTAAGTEQLAAAHDAIRVVEDTLHSALSPEAELRLCADLTACAAALTDLLADS